MVRVALTQERAVGSVGTALAQGLRKSTQEGTGSQDEEQAARLLRVRAVPCALLQLAGSLLQEPEHPGPLKPRGSLLASALVPWPARQVAACGAPGAAGLRAEDSAFGGHTGSGVPTLPRQAARLPAHTPLLALSRKARNHTGLRISGGRGSMKGRERALSQSAAPREAGRGRKRFLPLEPQKEAAVLTSDCRPVGTVLDFCLPELRRKSLGLW